MNITGFKISSFAKDEYTTNQEPEAQNLNGGPLLIKGPNRSGKSLTFNAILYGILGRKAMIAARPGSGNKVWVTFDDGSRIFRADPKRKYEGEGEVYTKEDAVEIVEERLGNVDVIKQHFLHSHLDELPLENLRPQERLDLILTVTDIGTKQEVEELEQQLEEVENELTEKKDRISPLERQQRRLQLQVSQHEGQQDDWEKVLTLTENGRLQEIKETLEEHEEIANELESLSERERGLSRKTTSKENEIEELQRYEQEVEDIIIEAMKEFVCPVCDDRVDSKSAHSRLRSTKCPFCKQDHSIQELKNHLHDEKNKNEGRPGQLAQEIAEHKNELEKIKSRIGELEEELPEISELNNLAVDKLREEGQTIEGIEEEAKKELPTVKDNLQKYRKGLEETTSQLNEVRESVQKLEEEKEQKEAQLSKLQSEDYGEEVSKFEEVWTDHFTAMAGDLGLEVTIDEKEGTITLPGGEDDSRVYNRRGDLSDSEIQLLNLSFALALNDFAVSSGMIDWECLVLDEPFSHLDEDTKEQALNHLLDVDKQIILTSSDIYVSDQFEKTEILELVRGNLVQTTVGEWGA